MTTAVASTLSVALEKVAFAYKPGRPVLDIPELYIEKNERVFVFGPSGSGKTTLLGLLAGVLQAQSGTVRMLGRDLRTMTNGQKDAFRASHVGYIFQMFNLIPYLSVLENITLPCRFSPERVRRLGNVPLEEAAKLAAMRLGIANHLNDSVVDLSVGQQQRVAAARALIGTPEIVIADEPTSSLDTDHRQRFIELLFESCSEAKSTVIFVSHDRTLMPLFDRSISLAEVNKVSRTVEF
jgi:putative ABC transport system ATP-binding protein